MQTDLVIYLFSRLDPKARHFFRSLNVSLSPLLLKKTFLLFSRCALHVSASNKIRRYTYLSVYANRPDPISFIPIAVSTSLLVIVLA
jgi:hypothetical protein